jgi:imipenem/basic amino acid-specific outer membrane pore
MDVILTCLDKGIMLKSKHSPVILALSLGALATVPTASADSLLNKNQQAEASGVIADAQWNLNLRSLYYDREYLNGGRSNGGRNRYLPYARRSDEAREWGVGVTAELKSGFTPGPVGFGLDAQLYLGHKLDGSDYSVGKIRMLPVSDDGYSLDEMARGGVAAKMRIRSSELRYGEQRVKTPVFSSSDSRLLPESMYGFSLVSRDIKGLSLQAGRFTGSTDRNSRNTNNDLTINYANPAMLLGDSFSYLGGNYTLSPALNLSLYTAELEDSWNTHYLGINHSLKWSGERSLHTSFQIYRSQDTGKSLAGEIDNTTASLFVHYRTGAHGFGLGYQKVDGDTPFDYVSRGAIWLSNGAQLSDFNGPNERSWQLRYDLDMAAIMPGMKLRASHFRGSGTDGTGVDPNGSYAWLGYGKGGKHWARDLRLDYTVQGGRAEGLTLSLIHSSHRANVAQAELDDDQIRFLIEYPISGAF